MPEIPPNKASTSLPLLASHPRPLPACAPLSCLTPCPATLDHPATSYSSFKSNPSASPTACPSTSSAADATASSSMFPKHFLYHILVIYFSLSPLRLHGQGWSCSFLFLAPRRVSPGMLHFQVEQQVISSGVGSLKFIVFSFFLLNLFNILNRVATK